MAAPLISVLVPVYNVEKYLERCLDSIIGQTLQDIEILCVDDGSTDGSPEILKRYEEKDSRIKVISKSNGGLPSARNVGLDAASGEYVGFVDSDDYIEPDMFRRLYETAVKRQSELVICGAHIFPEKPRAGSWLYDCLSPLEQHYDNFEPQILFGCVYTTPFLWRTLIKRSLIERYSLRLDESIMIGEDKAFQAKVYPKAKGITILPDKLYHYCWYREDSMMSSSVYKLSPKKVQAHCRLVEALSRQLLAENADDELKLAFLRWGIPFIYADFISQPSDVKEGLAENLVKVWLKSGYIGLKYKLESWIREQFEYFSMFLQKTESRPRLSVIVPVDGRAVYLGRTLNSILAQGSEIECILVNHGASEDTYVVMHKCLFSDKRVRLLNMERREDTEALNQGIQLAVGRYIVFCEPDGWYQCEDTLREWMLEAENAGADLCICAPCIEGSDRFLGGKKLVPGIVEMAGRAFLDNEYHNAMYKKAFLKECDLWFGDYSMMAGLAFWVKASTKAGKKTFFAKQAYVSRHMYKSDWLPTEECKKMLEGLEDIMLYSRIMADADIQAKVFSVLDEDYYKKIIINNTRAYSVEPEEAPKGENSQVEIFQRLFRILGMAEPQWLSDAGYALDTPYPGILYELIAERDGYLTGVSEQYHAFKNGGKKRRRKKENTYEV